jgi:hypothetical protein
MAIVAETGKIPPIFSDLPDFGGSPVCRINHLGHTKPAPQGEW